MNNKLSGNEQKRIESYRDVLNAIGDRELSYKEICSITNKTLPPVRLAVLALLEQGNLSTHNRYEAGRNIQTFRVIDKNLSSKKSFTDHQVAGIETYAILSGLNVNAIMVMLPKCKGDLVDKGWKRP